MKPIRWQMLLFQILFWVTTELTLNSLSFLQPGYEADDLADYSEYLMQKHLFSILRQNRDIPSLVHQG
jgi:hypothetical protein